VGAGFAWILSSSIVRAWCTMVLYELPNFSTREDSFFNMTWEISQWEFYTGIVTFYGLLFFGHLPRWRSKGFLDCACIHQTDAANKMLGVSNLASFLGVSDEMVILWDPLYFTRGWCGYELASYLALNTKGRIRLLPLLLPLLLVCHGGFSDVLAFDPWLLGTHLIGLFMHDTVLHFSGSWWQKL